jgi:tRNA 2-thiouridine synthesizing protein A
VNEHAPAQAIAADGRLDAGETKCGELLIMIFRAVKAMQPGQVLEVTAYSAGSISDIPAWCRLTGNPLLAVRPGEPAHFFIRKQER